MSRQNFHTPIEELERLVQEHRQSTAVLGPIWEELTFRTTDRARQLAREVRGLLDGTVPLPSKPPRPATPADQTTLF
jgi:hypothetical protein